MPVPQDLWVLIPVVAILSGSFKTWLKIKAQQRVLGTANRELEQEVAALRQERNALHQRIENIEAIVVSQTWNAIQDHSLPPAEREMRVASTVRREVAPVASGPSNQQRAEQLASRLRG
jgi:tRNA A37 N6-isopentenylltransferase MiaA